MEQDGIWNITWPTTMAGETAMQKCPGGSEAEGKDTVSSDAQIIRSMHQIFKYRLIGVILYYLY